MDDGAFPSESDHSVESHDIVQELLGAYSLDAVDADDAELIESHLRGCADCRAELDSFHELAGLIGTGDETPPDHVWRNIAERITTELPAERTTLSVAKFPSPDRRLLRFALAAVIILIAGIASLTVLAARQSSKIDQTNRQLAALQSSPSLASAADRLKSQPGTQQIALRAQSGTIAFAIVVSSTGEAYVVPSGDLVPLGHLQTYQLWGVHDGKAISLGLLGSHPQVSKLVLPKGLSAVAVTVEANPGVVVTKNQPVAKATI